MHDAERTHRIIHRLLAAVIMLTLADAAFTTTGILLGVITEGNPILKSAAQWNPILTILAAVIYTGGLSAVIYKYGHRCRYTIPLLTALAAVKLAVVGLHFYWISML